MLSLVWFHIKKAIREAKLTDICFSVAVDQVQKVLMRTNIYWLFSEEKYEKHIFQLKHKSSQHL